MSSHPSIAPCPSDTCCPQSSAAGAAEPSLSAAGAAEPSLSAAGAAEPSLSAAAAAELPPSLPDASRAQLSAQGLHELAVQAFCTGNRGRLSLCEALRVFNESRLFYELGFPSLSAYAGVFFQLGRAETFEHVRVAKTLVELTELREAFGQGHIGWTVLKAITRVASVDSQATWIEFVRKNGAERTLAEARVARRRRRDRPRDAAFGLPNLDQKLVLRFARSDMAKVRKWLEGACATVAEATGADDVSPEQAILFLCEQGMILDAGPGRVDGDPVGYRAQLVYQRCPDCRKARMSTRDGFVEVAADELERFEGSAEQVVLDGPTPPGLRRRVLAREAGRCGNPRCGYRADHCHHIVFRSRGGKTESANEVAVCRTCHALVHAGLLRVTGCGDGELQWRPVVSPDSLDREVASGRAVAERLPVLHLVTAAVRRGTTAGGPQQSANADSVRRSAPGEETLGKAGQSANADSAPVPASASPFTPARGGGSASATGDGGAGVYGAVNREDLAHGLKRLGVPLARSRQLIDAALAGLPRAEISEENLLRRAIRSI